MPIEVQFCNRNDLLLSEIEINMYPRNVWGTHQKQQIYSKAIIIEVDRNFKDIASGAMMVSFTSKHRYAQFTHFNKTLVSKELSATILVAHSKYQV